MIRLYFAVMFGIPHNKGDKLYWEPISLVNEEHTAIFTTKNKAKKALKEVTKYLGEREKRYYQVVQLDTLWSGRAIKE